MVYPTLAAYYERLHWPNGVEGDERPFPTRDLIGLELEFEEIKLKRDENGIPFEVAPPKGWQYHRDGSLRNNGLEFVFVGPTFGKYIAERLESLMEFIKVNKLKPDCSPRTSVHVHVDASDMTPPQLFKWLLIYTVYEPLLFASFAPDRLNSNFCVPLYSSQDTKDAVSLLKKNNWPSFISQLERYADRRRYSAINLDAIRKFCSLEFRHMGGEYKPKPIIDWISTLQCLKKWAMNHDTAITDIFHGPSKLYAENMTYNIFPREISERLNSCQGFRKLYFDGIRTAQEIVLDRECPKVPQAIKEKLEDIQKQKKAMLFLKMKQTVAKMKTAELDLKKSKIEADTEFDGYTFSQVIVDLDAQMNELPTEHQLLSDQEIEAIANRPREPRPRRLVPPRPIRATQHNAQWLNQVWADIDRSIGQAQPTPQPQGENPDIGQGIEDGVNRIRW